MPNQRLREYHAAIIHLPTLANHDERTAIEIHSYDVVIDWYLITISSQLSLHM